MKLAEAREHVGERVLYHSMGVLDSGVITATNDNYVMVQYDGSPGGTASYADDLVLITPELAEHLGSHLTDGAWHDGCSWCEVRRQRGGAGF